MKKLIFVFAFIVSATVCKSEIVVDNDVWTIERIDSANYYSVKKRMNPAPQKKPRKITDLKEVRKLLEPRGIKFVTLNATGNNTNIPVRLEKYDDYRNMVYDRFKGYKDHIIAIVIYPKTGKFYKFFSKPSYMYIDPSLGVIIGEWWKEGYFEESYYLPDQDILYLTTPFDEVGLPGNVYNFRTSATEWDVGDPDFWFDSPSKLFRLSKWYTRGDGETLSYLQKRDNSGNYKCYPEDFLQKSGWVGGYIHDAFWTSDYVLYFCEWYDWVDNDTPKYSRLRMK